MQKDQENNHTKLRMLVIGLGVLIILGLGILIWGIAKKASNLSIDEAIETKPLVVSQDLNINHTKAQIVSGIYDINIANNMQLIDIELYNGYMMAHLKSDLDAHQMMLIDLTTGKKHLTINLKRQP